MIVLDTNVLSETMRKEPHPNVMAWLNAQDLDALWLTSITVAELRFGAARLPSGKRRSALIEHIETAVSEIFAGRIAEFGIDAAGFLAERAAEAEAHGKRVEFADAAIAAIALAKGFSVATRDIEPFRAMGVDVIDPWA
jgi:predicted nucleic acid-binding protein